MATKKGKGTKAAKPKTTEKAPAKKTITGPGVIAYILEVITKKGPISRERILDELAKKFPDRSKESMGKTVMAQIGGKKRPTRMEKERKVKFSIDDEGRYFLNDKTGAAA